MKIKSTKILIGEALARAYAARHPLAIKNPGKVWGSYDGGGWIYIRGSGLKPHPDLAATHPNGWELGHRLRSGQARAELANDFARLWAVYTECGSFATTAVPA